MEVMLLSLCIQVDLTTLFNHKVIALGLYFADKNLPHTTSPLKPGKSLIKNQKIQF